MLKNETVFLWFIKTDSGLHRLRMIIFKIGQQLSLH